MSSMTVPSSKQPLDLVAAPGTTVTVTGFADNDFCYGTDKTFNSSTNNNTQVWTLRNGDTPPPFAPHGTQPTIDAFLIEYLDANGNVKLADNQMIYLFELYTTNSRDEAYDMQDIVVLATINPTTSPVSMCTVPTVVGMETNNDSRLAAVSTAIRNANLEPIGTEVNEGDREVQAQSPNGGTSVTCGSRVSYTYND